MLEDKHCWALNLNNVVLYLFCFQGWDNVFFMLIGADVLAAIVSRVEGDCFVFLYLALTPRACEIMLCHFRPSTSTNRFKKPLTYVRLKVTSHNKLLKGQFLNYIREKVTHEAKFRGNDETSGRHSC